MKYVLWLAAAVVAVIGAATLIGWWLPVGHVASRTVTLNAPAEAVYALVSDVAQYPKWRADVTRVEILDRSHGKLRFREHSSSGPILMEIEEASPPARMVTRIADPDQPFGGTWTYEIARTPTGASLTITERGEVYNPIFRFMSRFVFGHTATMDAYLDAISRKVG